MRLFAFLCAVCFFLPLSSALAYIEEDTTGMAEADAGEQNTNMYKLNARGDYFVKRLKKIDEYASKNKQYDLPDLSDINDINSFEQKNKEKEQNKMILADVTRQTSNPQQLKIVVKPDTYKSLIAVNEVRDTQVASVLQRQIGGGRR